VLAIVLTGLSACRRPDTERSGSVRSSLASALGAWRPLEGRLSGGFVYAPRAVAGSATPVASLGRLELTVRQILHGPRAPAGAEAAQAVAVVNIAEGRLPEAAVALDMAWRNAPGAAALASDLAAVRLALADASHDSYQAFQALLAADDAVAADPTLHEARFNRALALEDMGLDWEAPAAWTDYLALDPRSGWAREARAHLAVLAARRPHASVQDSLARLDSAAQGGDAVRVLSIAGGDRQAAREHAEQELLPAWARAVLNRQAAAGRILDVARRIGAALQRLGGEAMVADTVKAIDEAALSRNLGRLRGTATGLAAYGQGSNGRPYEAGSRRRLEVARRALTASRSPFLARVELQEAISDYLRSDYRSAMTALDRLGRQDLSRYPGLHAKVLRISGLIWGVQGEYSRALDALSASARLYQGLGETQNQVTVLTMLASAQQFAGAQEDAWRTRCQALRLSRNLDSRPYLLLGESAIDAFNAGAPRIALLFQAEALRIEEKEGNPALLAESWRTRAAILHRLGDSTAAHSAYTTALDHATRVTGRDARRTVRADVLATGGEILSVSDPAQALVLFRQVIAIFRATSYHLYLAQLHQKCAEAFLAVHDLGAAERQYRLAIDQRERQRSLLPDERRRTLFFDDVKPVFEEMTAFQFEVRRRSDRAFDYAERSRGRSLLDLIAASGAGAERPSAAVSEPLSAAAIRGALPRDTAVIAYAVLERSVLAWVLRRDSLHATCLRIGPGALAALVAAAGGARHAGNRAPSAPLARLFDELIAPVRQLIPAGSRVVFVADKFLAEVPFGALYDDSSGRYFIEDHALSTAPSCTVLAGALRRSPGPSPVRTSVLVVEDPLVGVQEPLAGARREAAVILRLYGARSALLSGAAATPNAVLAAMPRYEIVHFATHATSDPLSPEGSRLLLSPGAAAGGTGDLRAVDLMRLRLPRTRLVVLAACGTGSGRISNSEGTLSLARIFLADGVPTVIGSLWSADDEAAARLFIAFYQALYAGQDAMAAMRVAQIQLLHDDDPQLRQPAAWAAFEVVGGVRGEDVS
jgi:tetratricopeptide (TPR) repeat protein